MNDQELGFELRKYASEHSEKAFWFMRDILINFVNEARIIEGDLSTYARAKKYIDERFMQYVKTGKDRP